MSCLVILLLKVLLVWRLNVNWDEFFFLSHVHDLARGDLALVFQSLGHHLFRWLVTLGGDEMREIVAGRLMMTFLLGITILLTWKLASPVDFALCRSACCTDVCSHVVDTQAWRLVSSRLPSDSAGAACAARVHTPSKGARKDITAGALLGLAMAVTIKAALAAPIFMALVFFREPGSALPGYSQLRTAIARLGRFGLAAGVITAVITGAHWGLSLTSAPRETAGGFALRSARTTLIDVSFIPQAGFLWESLVSDALAWILIGVGIALAVVHKRRLVLAFGLALVPILYPQCFPYYYPVMFAPACVLAAIAFDALRGWTDRRLGNAAQNRIIGATICMLLLVGFILTLLSYGGMNSGHNAKSLPQFIRYSRTRFLTSITAE